MNRVAMVTGGSRGIGAATARLFAERGWDVAIGYLRADDAAQQVADDCRSHGVRVLTHRVDIAVEEEIVAFFQVVERDLGPITALVHSAGILDRSSRVEDMSVERLERMFKINVIGTFICNREAVRRMSTRNGGAGGAIVNLSSIASRLGNPGRLVDYAATKGAIDTLTIGLAREVAAEGIRVNAIRPSYVDTEMHQSTGEADRKGEITPLIPMHRVGTAEDIAFAAVWLCTEEAGFITGTLLDITGGR